MSYRPGRHFLQIPGPTNVPDRIQRAIAQATIDHRSADFKTLGLDVLSRMKWVFGCATDVVIFPGSGTGAWEAALVNVLSPGDTVLMSETGQFATLWANMAERLGFDVVLLPGDWRHAADLSAMEQQLRADKARNIRAVCVVHNETSTGVRSDIHPVRQLLDRLDHPALLLVDTISSLASMPYRHDDWGVDVTVCGSQKGLMLPPGLGFNAISAKAVAAAKSATSRRSYWDWQAMRDMNSAGFFPYTPATNMLFGLQEALTMLAEEGLENVFARHERHAEATRRAVQAWGLPLLAADPATYSASLTAVQMPDGHDADQLRATILDRFDMSLGAGLGRVKGKVFRIGHLGDFNDLALAGTLSGVEMGLKLEGIPLAGSGIAAALDSLSGNRL